MRAFFRIASIIGTGTDADPYRPAHTDTLTGLPDRLVATAALLAARGRVA